MHQADESGVQSIWGDEDWEARCAMHTRPTALMSTFRVESWGKKSFLLCLICLRWKNIILWKTQQKKNYLQNVDCAGVWKVYCSRDTFGWSLSGITIKKRCLAIVMIRLTVTCTYYSTETTLMLVAVSKIQHLYFIQPAAVATAAWRWLIPIIDMIWAPSIYLYRGAKKDLSALAA